MAIEQNKNYTLKGSQLEDLAGRVNDAQENASNALEGLSNKVDKETGKGLSTNDFTDSDKTKLDSVEANAQENTIESVSVNGTEITPDANKNVDINVPAVENSLTSESTTDALSAAQGKTLKDLIDNIVPESDDFIVDFSTSPISHTFAETLEAKENGKKIWFYLNDRPGVYKGGYYLVDLTTIYSGTSSVKASFVFKYTDSTPFESTTFAVAMIEQYVQNDSWRGQSSSGNKYIKTFQSNADYANYGFKYISGTSKSSVLVDYQQLENTIAPYTGNLPSYAQNGVVALSRDNGTAHIRKDGAWKELITEDTIEDIEPISGSGAPTTSTEGTLGQDYIDTTTGDKYYLSSIDETTTPATYNWTKLATGTGVNVVQTTGTSTTDVMSQDATTKMVYTSSGTGIRIGYGTAGTNHGIAIGYSSSTRGDDNGIAVGEGAVANSYNVALGSGANASGIAGMGVSIGRLAGNGMSSTIKGYVNLGSHSKATNTGEVNIGTSDTTEGYNSSNYRLFSGVYDPQSAHDAATKGYVDTNIPDAPDSADFNALFD